MNIEKEWAFIVREMRRVPREFPPMVVACRDLLFVLRDMLTEGERHSDERLLAAYRDLKKIYQQKT